MMGADQAAHNADYVRHPEFTVDQLREALEGMTVVEIASRNPGIDREAVALHRANSGTAWTARRGGDGSECICGEISARHCPVHNDGSADG